ncbi:MAG: hypothetical protein F4X41_08670 [Chloroflexi bacterium]|nr:hypothetical protein [Chloroflexota bacterium]
MDPTNPFFYLVAWPLLSAGCTFIGAPLAMHALRALPTRGEMLAKPIGWFVYTFAGWAILHTGLVANQRGFNSGLGWVMVMLAAAWLLRSPALRSFWKSHWRRLLTAELLFLAAFWGYLVLRAHVPGVMATEAPANFAILNTAMRSDTYPPADAWLAGQHLVYYYFGHAAAALGATAAGIPRLLAFDLALANLFGLAVLGAFALGRELCALLPRTSARLAAAGGASAVLLTLLSGNLAALAYWSGRFADDPFFYQGLSWNATRIIRNVAGGGLPPCGDSAVRDCPITETPVFTFLLGDLHAHALGLPLVLLAGVAAIAWWRGFSGAIPPGPAAAIFSGGVAGLALATNSWDFPLALGLGPIAGLAANLARPRPLWRRYFLHAALAALSALFCAAPQLLSYEPLNLGPAGAPLRSQLGPYLLMWGLPLSGFYAWRIWSDCARWGPLGAAPAGSVIALAGLAELSFSAGALVLSGGGALLALWAISDCARGERSGQLPFLMLAAAALLLIAVPEVIIVADGYSPPYVRMNTMFKLGFAAWTLFGAALPAMLISGWTELAGTGKGISLDIWRWSVAALLAGLLAISLGYSANAAAARVRDGGEPSLNALRTMQRHRPEDVAAANWAAANLPRDAVIMEACCRAYSDANRISNWTGVPGVIGWLGHGFLSYRSQYAEFAARAANVDAMYRKLNDPQIARELEANRVTHVVLGQLERDLHRAVDPAPAGPLRPVFTSPRGTLTIYALPRAGP